jgi:DNA segregation ATPase FtsK/SpoIIIE-like protein
MVDAFDETLDFQIDSAPALLRLLEHGPALGIHVIVTTQALEVDDVPTFRSWDRASEVVPEPSAVIAFRTTTKRASRALLHAEGAEDLPEGQGDAFIRVGSSVVGPVQMFRGV